MTRKMLGQYIVADPEINQGQPTFAGTPITVAQVLDQIAAGQDWDSIVQACGNMFPRAAIAEAVSLAYMVYKKHTQIHANRPATRTMLSQHIVADPAICHGQPTFVGTRIMAWQALEDVADGEDWNVIVDEWARRVYLKKRVLQGRPDREVVIRIYPKFPAAAVGEAITIAREILTQYGSRYFEADLLAA
jgi:uncharacterized protein (DUF433 family)